MGQTGRMPEHSAPDAAWAASAGELPMKKIVPYLIGGLVVLCVDYVPAATTHLGSVSAAIWAGQAPASVNTGANIDRSRKGDRMESRVAVKKMPASNSANEQAKQEK